MELAHDLGGAGVAGADRALEPLGAVLQLLEIGVAGKTAGWHCGLLSQWPGVRNLGPERRRADDEKLGLLRWASPFPRIGGDLLACADHNPVALVV